MTPVQRKAYENYLINLAIKKDVIRTAKKDGEKIGIEKGRKEERRIQEEKQYRERIEMARLMKNEGEPIGKIIKYTGLSKEEIEKL